MRAGDCLATIAMTSGSTNRGLGWIGQRVAVTAVFASPAAADMGRRTRRLQRQRKESSCEREQQQKSGNQTLHALWVRTPKLEVSIEQEGGVRKRQEQSSNVQIPVSRKSVGFAQTGYRKDEDTPKSCITS